MTTQLARSASRALTNKEDFNQGNTVVKRESVKILGRNLHAWSQTLTFYDTRLAYVWQNMLYIQVPSGKVSRTTMDRIIAILEMWGKVSYLNYLKQDNGRFHNLGVMN